MRAYSIIVLVILTSCKSAELQRSVRYFWPIRLHLGADISIVSRQLRMDTANYSNVGYAKHLKEYKLDRPDLDKLHFNNNYADSIKLYFYRNRLFSVDIHASGNRHVEYLKFDIGGQKESSLAPRDVATNDTTFHYGKYRELRYNATDGPMWFEYSEDIVDNTAVLTITNRNMFNMMPLRNRVTNRNSHQ